MLHHVYIEHLKGKPVQSVILSYLRRETCSRWYNPCFRFISDLVYEGMLTCALKILIVPQVMQLGLADNEIHTYVAFGALSLYFMHEKRVIGSTRVLMRHICLKYRSNSLNSKICHNMLQYKCLQRALLQLN